MVWWPVASVSLFFADLVVTMELLVVQLRVYVPGILFGAG